MAETDFKVVTTEEAKEARRIIPPIELPSTPVDPAEPWVPKEMLRRHSLGVACGWTAALFKAIGPRVDQHGYCADPGYRTLGLRLLKPGRRVVIVYGWRPDVAKPGWKFDGAWVEPGIPETIEGEPSQMHMSKVGVTAAEAAIKQ